MIKVKGLTKEKIKELYMDFIQYLKSTRIDDAYVITHVRSCLNTLPVLYLMKTSLQSDFIFVNAKPNARFAEKFLGLKPIWYHAALNSMIPVSLGLSYKNDKLVWIHSSESCLTNGLFWELLVNLDKNYNLLLTIDYNGKLVRHDLPDKAYKLVKPYVEIVSVYDSFEIDLFPRILLFDMRYILNTDALVFHNYLLKQDAICNTDLLKMFIDEVLK